MSIAKLLLSALFALSGLVAFQEYKPLTPLKQNITFDFNDGFASFSSKTLRMMSFGYSRLFSNLLWLRFLQETPPKSMGKNQVSWIFLDLNAISEIDPDFTPLYTHAAVFLSVVTEDKKGAEILLRKGVEKLPDNWRIRAYLAYHYQFELKDLPKALEQYRAGAVLPGAPSILGLVAAKLSVATGDASAASIAFIESLQAAAKDPAIKKRFEKRLEELKSKKL